MTIQAQLDDLRSAIPGCTLIAYGDRVARLVLRTSAEVPWRQERLDALCRNAAQNLSLAERLTASMAGSPDTDRAASPAARAGASSGTGSEAVVATDWDVRLFVGAGGEGSDLLCCILAPGPANGAATGTALVQAHAVLDRLPGAGA